MAKKLLVRTPQTTDGKKLAYENRQPVFKETILEVSAKPSFESLNNALPEELRHELSIVDVDDDGNIVNQPAAAKTAKGKKGDAGNDSE